MIRLLAPLPILLALLFPVDGRAQTASSMPPGPSAFTAEQRQEILDILRHALRTDPSLLRDAITTLQNEESERQDSAARAAIVGLGDALARTPGDPVAGNPNGDVTVVEFYDLRCPYCRRMLPVFTELLKRERNVRVVYKDIPILGPGSVVGARAVLAAQRQGGYLKLREALMTGPPQIDADVVKAAVQRLGLDWERLQRDMADPSIQTRLDANLKLARTLEIQGTPAYVIGERLLPGAVDIAELQKTIAQSAAEVGRMMAPVTYPAAGTAIVGAGIVGIAVAYYLSVRHGRRDVVLVDGGPPMGLTSARSGENFRNWWPQRIMQEFTSHSIAEMETIARETGNRIRMTRRGYVLATRRRDPAGLIAELHEGYGEEAARLIRIHDSAAAPGYRPAISAEWETAPDGVDLLLDRDLIRRIFPGFAPDIATVLHIRRGGDISGQQLGQAMLEAIRAKGGRLLRARVTGIAADQPFRLRLETDDGPAVLGAETVVNAAGPHAAEVGSMLGETLDLHNVLQQKVTFEDRHGAILRAQPFSIDLDGQTLDWNDDEISMLAADPATSHLTRPMPGGIHCRPDGGDGGTWIKLGWAINHTPGPPAEPPVLDPQFPDLVLRAASRLQPALRQYLGRLPRNAVHYGGYYNMTPENWPLIGPAGVPGAFNAVGLSGFGTMAACATGALTAGWITGGALPAYAAKLSAARHADAALMSALANPASKGVL